MRRGIKKIIQKVFLFLNVLKYRQIKEHHLANNCESTEQISDNSVERLQNIFSGISERYLIH